MTFGAKLKNIRLAMKLSQDEFAKKLNTTKQVISRYETEQRTPKISIAQEYADILGVSLYDLIDNNIDFSSVSAVRIPVLGKVAAGIPITAVENIIDYEEIPSSMAETGEYVALQINGSSMEPRMFEGDVVIVKVQPTVDSGEVAVVIINGNEATVKKVQLRPDGIVLRPFNSAYDPMFYTNEDIERIPVRIFGKVVECRQKY